MLGLRRWLVTGLVIFAAWPVLWSGSVAAQSSKPPVRHAHVYLLRGLINVFSLGMDELAAKIEQRGVYATVHNHLAWLALAGEAAANYRAGREGPIIIIGHSLGADAAVEMADELAREHVPVKLVVTFDPVSSMTVDGDIARVVNLYISDGWGASLSRGPKFRGTLINMDVRNRPDVGHIFIDKSASLHQQVLGYVMQAVTRNAAAAPPPPARTTMTPAAQRGQSAPASEPPEEAAGATPAPRAGPEGEARAPVSQQTK
jgi:fermentation-respiration switch protein FrsA (DUF1100 family)